MVGVHTGNGGWWIRGGCLRQEKKNGGLFAQVGRGLGFPLGDGVGLYPLVARSERAGDGQAGCVLQGLFEGVEHGAVAVGGFYQDLCLVMLLGVVFPGFELFGALPGFYGGVAVEGEALTVQAACHEAQQDG